MSGFVFISYKRGDLAYVQRLAKWLERRNTPVWFDLTEEESLVAGERFAEVIEQKLKECVALIVILTPEALASQWVRKEVAYALRLGKEVVPLVLRECDPGFLYADLHQEKVLKGSMPPESVRLKLAALLAAQGQQTGPSPGAPVTPGPPRPRPSPAEPITPSPPRPMPGPGAPMPSGTRAPAAPVGTPPESPAPLEPLPARRPLSAEQVYATYVRLLGGRPSDSFHPVILRAMALLGVAMLAAFAGALLLPPVWWVVAGAGGLAVLCAGRLGLVDMFLSPTFAFAIAAASGSAVGVGIRAEGTDGYTMVIASTAVPIVVAATGLTAFTRLRPVGAVQPMWRWWQLPVAIFWETVGAFLPVRHLLRSVLALVAAGGSVLLTNYVLRLAGLPAPDWSQFWTIAAGACAALVTVVSSTVILGRAAECVWMRFAPQDSWWYLATGILTSASGLWSRPMRYLIVM